MFQVGDRVGDYEIAAKLKAGGMATLFLGRRAGAAGFSRHVAIKVVHGHLAGDQAFVRMFLDEALLSARIHHPNVVHVEELGEADGTYFLVMEYVHGCALNQVLRALARQKRKLSPEMAVWIAIQVADGLHAAHEVSGDDGQLLGVVHRDVSPQNVLLAYKGHVKLIDFGIAKARGRAQQTATGSSIKGKLRYMSPEQAFGRAVDRTTDVYALAIVLWEMLTMRKMFDAENDFLLLDMVRAPTITPPSAYATGIPEALDKALLAALAPEAHDRPLSAKDFRRRLAEAMPAAMSLDAEALADLLSTLMSDDMDKERRSLPESLTGFPSRPMANLPKPIAQVGADDRDDIVHTVALDISDLAFADAEDGQSAPSNAGESAAGMAQVRAFRRTATSGGDAGGPPRTGGTLIQPASRTARLQIVTDTNAAAVLDMPAPSGRAPIRSVWIGGAIALVCAGIITAGIYARGSGNAHGATTPNAAGTTHSAAGGTATNIPPVPGTATGPSVVTPPNTPPAVVVGSNGAAGSTVTPPTPPPVVATNQATANSGERQGRRTTGRRDTTAQHTTSSTSGTTQNTGSQNTGSQAAGTNGMHTRMVNGVPIVQDDF